MILLLAVLGPQANSQCKALDTHSSEDQVLAFLRESKDIPPSKQNGECITFAIKQLEYKPSPQATDLLIAYLEFKRPPYPEERNGFMLHGPPTESNTHPAMGTLFTFGQSAAPALLSAIENAASPTLVSIATHMLMAIFRDQPAMGIEYLKERASSAEPSKAGNLKTAEREAMKWCGDKYKAQCEAALRN